MIRHSSFVIRHFLIAGVLLLAQATSLLYYAQRYSLGSVSDGPESRLSLEMTPDQWAQTICVRDAAAYLRCAKNVAAGEGVTIDVPGATPPRREPFVYWGPGAPVAMGLWMRLFGAGSMYSLFAFAALCQLVFATMAVLTARLYTRDTVALSLTATLASWCLPLQSAMFGINLTASETASLLPLSLLMFTLAKAFLAMRAEPRPWLASCRSPAIGWFAMAGLLIGVQSLMRDSGQVFGLFVALFVTARAVAWDRRRLPLAGLAAVVLIATTAAVRYPVEKWNYRRVGRLIVSSSGDVAIWRYGLWVGPSRDGIASYVAGCAGGAGSAQTKWWQDDLYNWCVSAGFGFGGSLDPAAPERVEKYFQSGAAHPTAFALWQYLAAVAAHPLEAIEFKATRAPVLWLGAEMWPATRLDLIGVWCLAHYGALAAYILVCRRRGQPIAEVTYLYLLLVVCASPLIHFEFRYTFPAWHTLVTVPGLLWAVSRGRVVAGEAKGESASAVTPEPARPIAA